MCFQSSIQAWQEQKGREIKPNPVIQPNWMRWKPGRQQLQETGESNRLILIQMFGNCTGWPHEKRVEIWALRLSSCWEFNCWGNKLIQVDGGEWNGAGIGVGEGVRKGRVKKQQSDCTAGHSWSSELCWSFCCWASKTCRVLEARQAAFREQMIYCFAGSL